MRKILSVLLALSLLFAMSVPAFAANNVTINQLVGPGEYKAAYVIPNASGKTTYAVSATDLADANTPLYAPQVDTLTGYTIASGTKIDLTDRIGTWWAMEEKNGKLMLVRGSVDYSKLVVSTANSVQFNAEGYYLFMAQYASARQDPSTAVILAVGKSGSAVTTSSSPQKATSSDSADKNTVKVAGKDRTPGQIQAYISGGHLYTVSSGDTLYDLAKRFYGNGNLWKELQKVNQNNLNETKDGVIFVGFNLILPTELGGKRSNVG